ncbi:MAG: PTS sugar transporter subunit IIA [bacterium]
MLAEYLNKNKILFDISAANYQQAIESLLQFSEADTSHVIEQIMERESIMSTALGKGVALPRIVLDNQRKTEVIMGIVQKGLKFKSFDLVPIKIIILHLFAKNDDHTAILAHTLRLMNDDNLKNEIINCRNAENVIDVIKEWEEEE